MSKQPASSDAVTKLVMSIMDSRRYKGFQIQKVEFAYFPSAYGLSMALEGKTTSVKIPSELIDDVLNSGDTFQKRKIKRMIKDALGLKHDTEE